MRKPVSKNALRRAVDRAVNDGQIQTSVPLNAVIDRIWHDLERQAYGPSRKKGWRARGRAGSPTVGTDPELVEA